MAETYVGWIPNVSGRLSFSVVGDTKWPNVCHTINFRDGQRYIYCLQKRVLSDTLVPNFIVSVCDQVEPTFWFLLVANSERHGEDEIAAFRGEVFIIENYRAKKKEMAGQSLLNRLRGFPDQWRQVSADRKTKVYEKYVAETLNLNLFKENYYARCVVEVDRQGIVRLSDIAKNKHISLYQSLRACSVENDGEVNRILYGQVFYFLKDIAHKHKHHARKHDSIVSVIPEDSDLSWARETMYGLHKKVITNRRNASTDSLCDAQGIIAYMKSFQQVLERDKAVNDQKHGYKIAISYKLDQIDASIKAELEKIKINRTQMNLFLVAIPVISLSLMNTFRADRADATPNIFWDVHNFLAVIFSPTLTGGFLFSAAALAMPFYYYAFTWKRIPILKAPHATYEAFDKAQKSLFYFVILLLAGVSTCLTYAVRCMYKGLKMDLWNGLFGYYLEALPLGGNHDRITGAIITWILVCALLFIAMPTILYLKQIAWQQIKWAVNKGLEKIGLKPPPAKT